VLLTVLLTVIRTVLLIVLLSELLVVLMTELLIVLLTVTYSPLRKACTESEERVTHVLIKSNAVVHYRA
jgi:hypothetical protein